MVRDSSRLDMDMSGNTGTEVVGEAEAGVYGCAPPRHHCKGGQAFPDTGFRFTLSDLAYGRP